MALTTTRARSLVQEAVQDRDTDAVVATLAMCTHRLVVAAHAAHLACWKDDLPMLKDLVQLGGLTAVDLQAVDHDGNTCVDWACYRGNIPTLDYLDSLGAAGTDVLCRRVREEDTCAHTAIDHSDLALLEWLRDHGAITPAVLHHKNDEGLSCIDLATKRNNRTVMQWLRDNGFVADAVWDQWAVRWSDDAAPLRRAVADLQRELQAEREGREAERAINNRCLTVLEARLNEARSKLAKAQRSGAQKRKLVVSPSATRAPPKRWRADAPVTSAKVVHDLLQR